MIPIISLLLILGTSLIVTRVAAVALEHTGLSRDSARFQARSAFTGVGFTTTEAEDVVGHPVRRRIVMWLMLVGNVGIVSAMAAVLLSAIDLRSEHGIGILLAVLVGGLALLYAISASRWVDLRLCAPRSAGPSNTGPTSTRASTRASFTCATSTVSRAFV